MPHSRYSQQRQHHHSWRDDYFLLCRLRPAIRSDRQQRRCMPYERLHDLLRQRNKQRLLSQRMGHDAARHGAVLFYVDGASRQEAGVHGDAGWGFWLIGRDFGIGVHECWCGDARGGCREWECLHREWELWYEHAEHIHDYGISGER